MSKLARAILIGASIGIGAVGVFAAPTLLQAAMASDEVAPVAQAAPIQKLFPKTPAFDMARLRKFDFSFDSTISVTPERTVTISKYGFGEQKFVTISKTPSGTYSSDAITSPYVKYPGITVRPNDDFCSCVLQFLEAIPKGPFGLYQDESASSFLAVPAPTNANLITWL